MVTGWDSGAEPLGKVLIAVRHERPANLRDELFQVRKSLTIARGVGVLQIRLQFLHRGGGQDNAHLLGFTVVDAVSFIAYPPVDRGSDW